MSLRIAVLDPLPVFRHGLMAALGLVGLDPEVPNDLLTWSQEEQRRVIFLTLQSASDWLLLAETQKARGDHIVIAVLTDHSTATYVRAILTGATVAVPRDATPDTIRRIFDAAVSGESVLPLHVVRALASAHAAVVTDENDTSQQDLEWLRELVGGVTVAQLAERAGYSERSMFRLLRDLYRRMGVKNRTEALIQAKEQGLI
jgi:DNA-binding NarL/FixJ family response regulator